MMVNAALSERPQTAVALDIVDRDKSHTEQQRTEKLRGQCFRRRLRRSTILDIIIYLLVVTLVGLVELGFLPTAKLGFTCKDPSISYPFKGDTISATCLIIGSFLIPLCVIIVVETLREKSIRRICLGNVWKYYKEAVIGLAFLLMITALMKVFLGELRPHFFDTCVPDANQNCIPGTFIQNYNCTNTGLTRFQRTDILRSFPSGHTAASIFISLYSAYLINTRIPEHSISIICRAFLISLCLSWTIICSITRITDRRHHWWDVLGGAFLGFLGVCYFVSALKEEETELIRSNTSTTLIDVKNKDATSVMI